MCRKCPRLPARRGKTGFDITIIWAALAMVVAGGGTSDRTAAPPLPFALAVHGEAANQQVVLPLPPPPPPPPPPPHPPPTHPPPPSQ